jgi:futalosine hydrolase
MKILIVAATQMEIVPFLHSNNNIESLITGMGIHNTVYHLTKKLLQDNYNLVIQAGIAGSFTNNIKKGDVVVVEQDAFADYGVEEKGKFKTMFDVGFDDENKFPFKNGWLINCTEILELSDLKKVNAVTVNKIIESKKGGKQLKEKFTAEIETLEGAAFHFVCLQQNIPFLQLRAISNKVGERDKSKWRVEKAIGNLNTELIKLLKSIHE